MEKILIVRLGAMGDVIHALPAVRDLRDTFPQANIDWVIEENWVELLCAKGTQLDGPLSAQKPLVNKVHVVNTKRWRRNVFAQKTREEIASLRGDLRERHYDMAIDLQGALKSAIIARFSGASLRVGYVNPRESWARLFYTQLVRVGPGTHVIDQAKRLVQAAIDQRSGTADKSQSSNVLLPLDPRAEQWCEAEIRSRNLEKFVILNPGAGWGAKQWPAQRYGELALALASDGLRSIVNIGPGAEEKRLGALVGEASQGSAQAISCSIGELISLTRRASLFVGGDTGPMHLAAALGIPVVALFGPTDPQRNGPYYLPNKVLRSDRSVVSYSHRNQLDAGLMSISVEEVVAAVRELLSQQKGRMAKGVLQ